METIEYLQYLTNDLFDRLNDLEFKYRLLQDSYRNLVKENEELKAHEKTVEKPAEKKSVLGFDTLAGVIAGALLTNSIINSENITNEGKQNDNIIIC